jgi:hypothetical protein
LFGTAYAALLNDAQGFELLCGSISVFLRQSERNLAARYEPNERAGFCCGSAGLMRGAERVRRHPQRENPQF